MKKRTNNKGITLIALVITIITLLILAGVSIAMLTGDNGILTQAQNAKNKTEEAEEKERIQLAVYDAQLGNEGYQDLTEESLQKAIDEEFGSGEVRVYPNEKNAFSFIFQNKEANYRLEKDGTLNKIDIALKIYDIGDFEDFVDKVNAGNTFENQYVYLMENMDLKNQEWNVIGSYTDDTNNQPFAGIFEGNNRTINGLNINKSQDYVGLFAYNTGTIRDIILESGNITGNGRVGGIAAVNSGLIENCHNNGTTINASGVGAGGIVGRCNGEIKYCSNEVDINCENASYVAGIAGALNYSSIIGCYNTGNIKALYYAGGVVGGSTEGAIIENSYNLGEIEANYFVGGIAGHINRNSNIKYCYNAGSVKGTGRNENEGTCSGGIAGRADTAEIQSCYNSGTITSNYMNGGGITGQLYNQGKITNCYNVGQVVNQGTSLGNITGSVYAGAIVKNSYFSKEICDLNGIGTTNETSTIEAIEKNEDYMKTGSFVNELNKDDDAFTISRGLNNGYPVLKWQID